MTTIYEESSLSQPSERIELFTIDITNYGDTVYHLVRSSLEPIDVVFNGVTYTPFDFVAEGFELNGKDASPTPKLTVSGTDQVFTGLINNFNDLIGCKVTRTVTFRKFLDDSPTANPDAHFPLDIYRIERKSSENKFQIEFELASVLDQQGRLLPGRVITPSYCPWIYRIHNGGTSGNPLLDFDYHPADNGCPYMGSSYFDIEGNVTTAANDKPSKRVETCCKPRFGDNAVLPFGGFPGASRSIF